MAPYKILKQGYMMKEPPISKRGIRKRIFRYWFVLVEDRTQVALVYFKNEDAYIARHRNEGFIRVDQASNISVVGEYMGHKNAFVVKTPKREFHIIPESRYDLHEWLFTLHNALESFNKKMEKIKKKQQQEQLRQELSQQSGQQAAATSNGASEARSRASAADLVKTSTTAGHTPPYRRAPPPPRDKRDSREVGGVSNGVSMDEGRSPRRRPARPAPQAPVGRRTESGSSLAEQFHGDMNMASPVSVPQYSPPHPLGARTRSYSQDGYSTMESERGGYSATESERDGYSTLESGQHVMVDLTISHSDREPLSLEEGEDQLSPLHTHQHGEPHLALMQQMSSSLPEMLDEAGNSTSPEAPEENNLGDNTNKTSPNNRHTRHLSLIGGSKKDVQSRRKPKRAGSLKQRSRSPPNLPPPPPPPSDPTLQSDTGASYDLNTSGVSMKSNTSSASLGFSEVMNTMSSIDHELDAITENITTSAVIKPSTPPGRPPPPPPTQVDTATVSFDHGNLGPSPVPITPSPTPLSPPSQPCKVPSPVPEVENENGDFCEEEWLCDEPENNEAAKNRVVNNGHAQNRDRKDSSSDEAKPKKQLRVMFKDEVEAIPSYEPRVDVQDEEDSLGEETAIDDDVPSGVAAIKMKLFGQKEAAATRYKKEGVLSPKFTHPANMTFSEHYFDTDVMDNPTGHTHDGIGNNGHAVSIVDHHDNANNNNSENHSSVTEIARENTSVLNPDPKSSTSRDPVPPDSRENKATEDVAVEQPLSSATLGDGDKKIETKHHNVYECPWEDKPISKYKVIGIVRKTASPSSKTPPPTTHKTATNPTGSQRMQFAEVSTKETPKPSATEVRNVHSLERNMLQKTRSLPLTHATTLDDTDDSLLASISSTLKETSVYGSDTLLCNGADDKESKVPTAKMELEKIRGPHRTEDTPITYSSSVVSLPDPSQYAAEYSSAPSSADSTPFKHGLRGNRHQSGGLAATRMTKSLDGGLQSKKTHVTYNHHMHAHILRSLV